MSHEGIRMVSAEEAARAEPEKLSGDAIRPAKVRVDQTGGTGMRIEWRDGHVSEWSFAWLRGFVVVTGLVISAWFFWRQA